MKAQHNTTTQPITRENSRTEVFILKIYSGIEYMLLHKLLPISLFVGICSLMIHWLRDEPAKECVTVQKFQSALCPVIDSLWLIGIITISFPVIVLFLHFMVSFLAEKNDVKVND